MTMTVLYFLECINSFCLARRMTRGPWIIAYFSLQDLLARDLDWLYASFEVDTLILSNKLSEAFRLSRSLSISLFDYVSYAASENAILYRRRILEEEIRSSSSFFTPDLNFRSYSEKVTISRWNDFWQNPPRSQKGRRLNQE